MVPSAVQGKFALLNTAWMSFNNVALISLSGIRSFIFCYMKIATAEGSSLPSVRWRNLIP